MSSFYHYYGIGYVGDSLSHTGVKGMKWGHRKEDYLAKIRKRISEHRQVFQDAAAKLQENEEESQASENAGYSVIRKENDTSKNEQEEKKSVKDEIGQKSALNDALKRKQDKAKKMGERGKEYANKKTQHSSGSIGYARDPRSTNGKGMVQTGSISGMVGGKLATKYRNKRLKR